MTDKSQKTKKSKLVHPRIQRAISKLGNDISHARRARGISQEDFANNIGVSRMTLIRLENGDPGINLGTLTAALHVIGRLDVLTNIADPMNDDITFMQMKGHVPKKIAKPRAKAIQETDETEIPDHQDSGSKFVGF